MSNASLEREIFTFTWSIENFSMCPQKYKEFIDSPVFVVNMLNNSEWFLRMYPRGLNSSESDISCFLYLSSNNGKELAISYQLKLLTGYGSAALSKKADNRKFGKDSNRGFVEFTKRNVIFAEENSYLPNDTLTIQCSIWRSENDQKDSDINACFVNTVLSHLCTESGDFSNSTSAEEIYAIADDKLDELKQYCPHQCLARTRIEMERRAVTRKIERFGSMVRNQKRSALALSILKNHPSLLLNIYSSSEFDAGHVHIEIHRKGKANASRNFVKCKVTVLGEQKDFPYSIEDEHFYEPGVQNDTWILPPFIENSKLTEEKHKYLKNDVLTLLYEFAVSQLGSDHHIETYTILPPQNQNQVQKIITIGGLSNQLRHFYKENNLCDVSLEAGGRNFSVHKTILCARSSVFRAMFENIREKNTSVVNITDIEADTLDQMLEFMYSDILNDLNPKSAVQLYLAADKYEVELLKYFSSYLTTVISMGNMCELLSLANLYRDERLMRAVEKFIYATRNESFNSSTWKDFMKDNCKLAATIMHKVLVSYSYLFK